MNKKILTAILISIALPGGMLSAPADSLRLKSYKLDEVVVTGTRNETDIRHLPMTISVVGRQQLEQTYQPSILPALTEQVPGLFTTSRGIMGYGVSTGAAGGMSLRGIGGSPTAGLLVLIDGHPQYMGLMGHPIADAYQTMLTDRVEVLRAAPHIPESRPARLRPVPTYRPTRAVSRARTTRPPYRLPRRGTRCLPTHNICGARTTVFS